MEAPSTEKINKRRHVIRIKQVNQNLEYLGGLEEDVKVRTHLRRRGWSST